MWDTDRLALNINHLKDPPDMFYLKNFISQCIKSELVPKIVECTLKPTTEKYNQEFIDNWYSNLKGFFLVLMEQILSLCNKRVDGTTIKISKAELIRKQQLEKKEHKEIKKIISLNEIGTKKILHQPKFKKYRSLKFKSTPEV